MMPDKCDYLSGDGQAILSRLEAQAAMVGPGPAGQAGDDTAKLLLNHGRYAG